MCKKLGIRIKRILITMKKHPLSVMNFLNLPRASGRKEESSCLPANVKSTISLLCSKPVFVSIGWVSVRDQGHSKIPSPITLDQGNNGFQKGNKHFS